MHKDIFPIRKAYSIRHKPRGRRIVAMGISGNNARLVFQHSTTHQDYSRGKIIKNHGSGLKIRTRDRFVFVDLTSDDLQVLQRILNEHLG